LIAGNDISTNIGDIDIWLDDKEIGIYTHNLVYKAIWQLDNKIGDIYRKFAIYQKVPAAASDGGPNSLPSPVEWILDDGNYIWLDFTDEPIAAAGHKLELEFVFGNANPIRIIPVVAKPV